MRAVFLTCLAAAISGCGTTSGILPMGPDTYRISASKHQMAGGSQGAQSDALMAASAHCMQAGKELMVVSTSSSYNHPLHSFTANFQCLRKGDPDLARPNMQPAPSVLIEDRRR